MTSRAISLRKIFSVDIRHGASIINNCAASGKATVYESLQRFFVTVKYMNLKAKNMS